MRIKGTATGEQFAQVDNPDPFAPPVWRSPVYRTPEVVIWIVRLARLLVRVIWFVICHPLLDMAAGLVILDWLNLGWPGLVALAGLVLAVLTALRLACPGLFARLVTAPVRDGWRHWSGPRGSSRVGGGPGLDPNRERLSAGLFALGPHGLRARSPIFEGQERCFTWWAVQDLNLWPLPCQESSARCGKFVTVGLSRTGGL